jgi:hypothetical protein
MNIIEKYRKILEKPVPEPFKSYLEELVLHIEGQSASKQFVLPKKSGKQMIHDFEKPAELE